MSKHAKRTQNKLLQQRPSERKNQSVNPSPRAERDFETRHCSPFSVYGERGWGIGVWRLNARIMLLLLLLLVGFARVAAQDETADPVAQPDPPSVTGFDPASMVFGQGGQITVNGANLPAGSVVKLGDTALSTSVVDSTRLTATVPPGFPVGKYAVKVVDNANQEFYNSGAVTFEVKAPPPTPAPVVSNIEPTSMMYGQGGQITIIGTNLPQGSVVRLGGFGVLQTTFVNPGLLTAVVPATVPVNATPGYTVEVVDSAGQSYPASQRFRIIPLPPPTNPPAPTNPPPTQAPPPTDVPGAPSLLIRSFNATPSKIKPGDSVTFSFDVVNQGSRTAQGISLSVDSGGKFIPANGQASVLVPDLAVGAATAVSLTVVSATDTPGGAQTVGITMTFRDFTGQSYTSKGTLSVNVEAVAQASQVTLARYMVDPNPVIPGKPVKVTLLLTNTGNQIAGQVLVRIASDGSILLAGPQGDSFPVGDMSPGQSASVEIPMIVSSSAKSGPQAQAVTISFLQGGDTKSSNGSMTIDVAKFVAPAPLMLLDSVSTDAGAVLTPGQQFKLTLKFKNVGDDNASNTLVTFGTVESSGDSGTPGAPGSGSSTTASSTFAPLGSGGSVYVGNVAKNNIITVEQEFIVNGSVDSGIYSLPVTLRYQKSDGSVAQDKLPASLVVVVPPQLQYTEGAPLPPTVNVGETLPLALTITNKGKKQVNFTRFTIEAENADVIDGRNAPISPINTGEEASVNGAVSPSAEGHVKIKLTLYYTDDLNKPQTIVKTYEADAVPPPPPIDMGPTNPQPTPPPIEGENPSNRDSLGRLLLGLLGLGS
jgi:hypothetical protein